MPLGSFVTNISEPWPPRCWKDANHASFMELLGGLSEILSQVASLISDTQRANTVAISATLTSRVVEISKLGLLWDKTWGCPKPDAVNVQRSSNPDVRTTSTSAPYAGPPERSRCLHIHPAVSQVLQLSGLQQHLCLGDAKWKFSPMLLWGSREWKQSNILSNCEQEPKEVVCSNTSDQRPPALGCKGCCN